MTRSIFDVPFAIAGGLLCMLFLYFVRETERKIRKFVALLDDPYIVDENSLDSHFEPGMKKYPGKIMVYSFLKYLGFLFFIVLVSYGLIIFALVPAYVISLYYIIRYIKLWKYHKYSVLLLMILSAAVLIGSLLFAPFVRGLLWQGMSKIGGIVFYE